MRDFFAAIEFLTVVPVRNLPWVRRWLKASDGNAMGGTLPWFPIIGGLLGAILAGLDWLVRPYVAHGVRDAGLLVGLALVTGMLHLDGFIDCCDGLLGTRDVARRLEILRDSRVGAYGAIGGALLLLTQFAALEAIPTAWRPLALILAPTLGRWGMVWAVVCYPYARPSGLGSGFAGTKRHLTAATLVTLGIAALASLTLPEIWLARLIIVGIACVVALAATLGWTRWASQRLGGGLTGDTYGAANEIITALVWICLSRP